MRLLAPLAVAAATITLPGNQTLARKWVDSTGKHSVEAELVSRGDNQVVLERTDGKVIQVPINRLSQQDRDYLEQLHKQKAASSEAIPNETLGDEVIAPTDAPVPATPASDPSTPSADSSADATGPAQKQLSATTGDWIEIEFKGRKMRVPVSGVESAEIELGGKKFRMVSADQDADVSPAPREASAENTNPRAPAPVTRRPAELSNGMAATLAVLTTVCLGLLGYFFIYEPYRRQRPLREALQILHKEQRPLYSKAEELLDQSLLAGLRKKNISISRFALAFVRSQLGKHEEAATALSDLKKSGAMIDRPTAYLMLWVYSRVKNHERVERIYNEHEDQLRGYQQADMIVSSSYLSLGFLRLARREISGALHFFAQVRKLDVLADEIPSHLDDHEVVHGIVALFEKNYDEAKKHFQAAVDTATERNKPAYAGRLGLLLCRWRGETLPEIDDALSQVLTEIQPHEDADEDEPIHTQCPHCNRTYRLRTNYLGKRVQCKEAACRRRFVIERHDAPNEDDLEAVSDERLFTESDLLLRNSLLFHCITRLALWLRLNERSGLSDAERKIMRQRLDSVTQLDPDFGDAYLIDGLLSYYFARNEDERKVGHQKIEKAVELDVHVPEVLKLLECMNTFAQLTEQGPSYFHQLSGQYAMNAEVDPQMRERFVRNMNRYRRFRELGTIDSLPKDEIVAPTVENLQGRGQILRNRVSNIVRYNLADEDSDVKEAIQSRLDQLDDRSKTLAEEAKAFQDTELELMESTGEFLFHDEDPTNSRPPSAVQPEKEKD